MAIAPRVITISTVQATQVPNTTAARWASIVPSNGFNNSVESQVNAYARTAGTLRSFAVRIQPAPGNGKRWTFTVRKAGVDTAAVVTLKNTETVGAYSSATGVTLASGDKVVVRCDPRGTPTTMSYMSMAFDYQSTTQGESCYLQGMVNLQQSGTSSFSVFSHTLGQTPANSRRDIVSTAGTMTGTLAGLAASPAVGTQTEWALVLNGTRQDGSGGTVDTRITFVSGESGVKTASFSLPVAVGDTISHDALSGAIGVIGGWCSALFVATSPEIFILAGQSDGAGGQAVRPYYPYNYGLSDGFSGWTATEDQAAGILPVVPFNLNGMRLVVDTAPGAGKSVTFTARRNKVTPSGSPSVTITDTNTSGVDTTGHIDGLSFPDTLNALWTGTGSPVPATTIYRWSSPAVFAAGGEGDLFCYTI